MEVLASDHLAAADEKDLHTDTHRRACHANRILIARSGHDILPLGCLAHGGQLVAQTRGCLKVIPLCRQLHAMLQLPLHIVRPSLEKKQDRMDHRTVILLRYLLYTGRETAFDMVFKTGTVGHNPARSQRKKALQEL